MLNYGEALTILKEKGIEMYEKDLRCHIDRLRKEDPDFDREVIRLLKERDIKIKKAYLATLDYDETHKVLKEEGIKMSKEELRWHINRLRREDSVFNREIKELAKKREGKESHFGLDTVKDGGKEVNAQELKYQIIKKLIEGYSFVKISKEIDISYRKIRDTFWWLIFRLAGRDCEPEDAFFKRECLREILKSSPPNLEEIVQEISLEIQLREVEARRNLLRLWGRARINMLKTGIDRIDRKKFLQFIERLVRRRRWFSMRRIMKEFKISKYTTKTCLNPKEWDD
jgi:hypothetical protein